MGPYPGTFTETVRGTAGPRLALSDLTATFAIDSANGRVTGTKSLGRAIFGCYQDPNNYLAYAVSDYRATIHTAQGNYADQGQATTLLFDEVRIAIRPGRRESGKLPRMPAGKRRVNGVRDPDGDRIEMIERA